MTLCGVTTALPLARNGAWARSTSRRSSAVVRAVKDKQAIAAVTAAALLSAPSAKADSIGDAVDSITAGVQTAGDAARLAVDSAKAALEVAKQAYEAAVPVVTPYVKQAAEVAAPVVQESVKLGTKVAGDAFSAVGPSLDEALKQATGAVAGLGIDDKLVDSVATAAKPVVSAAGTVAGSAAEVLATSSPVTAAEYVAVAALGVYLTPSLFGLLFDLLRGYRGDLTATLAVDKLQSDRSAVLVDVRAAKEKDVAGLPDVPGSAAARLLAVEFATTEDRQLRNQLRNPTAVETTVTALQIANLKKVAKGSPILLLDQNGGQSKSVARELSRLGFSQVYVVEDGFKGWVASKLATKEGGFTTTVLPGSTIFGRPGTSVVPATYDASKASANGKRALPSPRK